jgi:hypothetical protein
MRNIVLRVDKVIPIGIIADRYARRVGVAAAREINITSDLKVTLNAARRAASTPYATVFLLVTILLSLWAGLCAA